MLRKAFFLIFTCAAAWTQIHARELPLHFIQDVKNKLSIDLRNPTYSDGKIKTDSGGVISAPLVRIQAQCIEYQIGKNNPETPSTIIASGNLAIALKDYFFLGEQIFYNFSNDTGQIEKGITQVGNWYLKADEIDIKAQDHFTFTNLSITPSENRNPTWMFFTPFAEITPDEYLKIKNLQIKLRSWSLMTIPAIKIHMDTLLESPVRYRFKWGGREGPRFGIAYQFYIKRNWKTTLRFDYRITKGPGFGIESNYFSEEQQLDIKSINYIACDSSLLNSNENFTYRFEGTLKKEWNEEKTSLFITYDKISDLNIPTSYYDRDFDFEASKKTQLLLRHQEDNWISSFYARVRFNNFQTVKQELPHYQLSFHPYTIGKSGAIFNHNLSASFLDFIYASNACNSNDYSSIRCSYQPTLYRPFAYRYFTFTPLISAKTIFYSNSPNDNSQILFSGHLGLEAKTKFHRYFSTNLQTIPQIKHVVQPYLTYDHYTFPTSNPNDHYIFDINDGVYQLNQIKVGLKNTLFTKSDCATSRLLSLDIYGFSFIKTKSTESIPSYIATTIEHQFFSNMNQSLDLAWNLNHLSLRYFNLHTGWTFSQNLAFTTDFRHRNSYSWRKADPENFFLEAFVSEERLRKSSLSDKRDSFLMHLFYKFHPEWACEAKARFGWNRFCEPPYAEYEIDFITTIESIWLMRFSFQRQEGESRVVFYLTSGSNQPCIAQKPVIPSFN